MHNCVMAEFWTCFDKPNDTLITTIYMQNVNHDFIWRKYSFYFVTESIFFPNCHLVILILLLAQCHINVLRPLQPLSFIFCDGSLFYSCRYNQFRKETVYVSDLCNLPFFWSWVVSCCMPSIISGLAYNLINVAILAVEHVFFICVAKIATIWVIFSILWVAVFVLCSALPISAYPMKLMKRSCCHVLQPVTKGWWSDTT